MKNYLIVGGSSGIGQVLVNQLSAKGHNVYATYNKTEVSPSDPKVQYHHLDVRQDVVDLSFLPDQIDGLVYCPGSINLMPFHRIKPTKFLEDYQLQVVGAVNILQQVLPYLKKSESASVLFFSTVAVQTGFNFHTQVAASKGAIEGLTRSLAAEWAPKIRVNAIAPSITNTPLASKLLSSDDKIQANADRHPLKKIGSPEDIANAAFFLLSEQSSWITGQILNVDGGISSLKI
jgi:NAD(P)-dependent dehydrogenase (short-subunit alcohol dehydrogenase family)